MSGQEKSWKDLTIGAVSSKSSTDFLTGDWKTYMPVCNFEKCVNCLTCVLFCPEGAIRWNVDDKQVMFNLNFCKGCGICANECPVKVIEMKMPEKEE
jgi:pyruvate ferredoxin oxidoreductase delta subunit